MAAQLQPAAAGKEIVITRVLDAPRPLVFAAWSQPQHLLQWFAPKHCTAPYCAVDFRVGGKFHFCMRFDSGRDIWGVGTYTEIVVPEHIAYVDAFADAQGNEVSPAFYGMSAAHPARTLVTVTLDEQGGRTRLTLRHAIAPTVPEHGGTRQGWSEMFDRLANLTAQSSATQNAGNPASRSSRP